MGALAATGVVLGAIYLLWMFQKVFFGKLDKAKNGRLPDLNGRELATFVPLVIGIFLLGAFPSSLLVVMEPSVQKFTREFGRKVAECDAPVHTYGAIVCGADGKWQPDRQNATAKPGAPKPPGGAGAGTGSAGNAGSASTGSNAGAGSASPGSDRAAGNAGSAAGGAGNAENPSGAAPAGDSAGSRRPTP
jgi:hypothetical protein